MNQLTSEELDLVQGGSIDRLISIVGLGVTLVGAGSGSLQSFGRGLGSGLYDAIHQ